MAVRNPNLVKENSQPFNLTVSHQSIETDAQSDPNFAKDSLSTVDCGNGHLFCWFTINYLEESIYLYEKNQKKFYFINLKKKQGLFTRRSRASYLQKLERLVPKNFRNKARRT